MKWPLTVRLIVLPWPRREDLACVALIASIAGAAVLTGLLGWAMAMLERAARWDAITSTAYGLLAIVAMIILSLGLAVSRRSLEAEFWKVKFKASNGEGDV